mgnify:CR=1 FL=1
MEELRRCGAHTVVLPDGTILQQAVVEIAEGRVVNYYEFREELPMTEWLGGEIRVEIDDESDDGYRAQQAEPELADKRHAPRHSVVLNEIDKKPICNTNRLAKAKVGLDVQLNPLVDDKQHNHHCRDEPADM